MKTYTNQIYPTLGADGRPNGRIIRVWEREAVTDQGHALYVYAPGQVYVTTILPGCVKGPHLHMKRDSLFCCVRGTVRITTRTERIILGASGMSAAALDSGAAEELVRVYESVTSGVGIPGEEPLAVCVPAGTPCSLYNAGHEEALVVNVSSDPYDAMDEHEVLDWRPE